VKKMYSVCLGLTTFLFAWMCILSAAYAGTTQGTVVGLRDAGENNWELVIQTEKGKKMGFEVSSYDEYQQWNDKSNKGKKVSITWSESGTGKYVFKVLNKIEYVGASQSNTKSSKDKLVKIIKIEDFSETTKTITTDDGEYYLAVYNKKYKSIIKKIKSNVGKKMTLILDTEGDHLILDVK